jgi:hypothetical protein
MGSEKRLVYMIGHLLIYIFSEKTMIPENETESNVITIVKNNVIEFYKEKIREIVPGEIYGLIIKCLNKDPKERPSVDVISELLLKIFYQI